LVVAQRDRVRLRGRVDRGEIAGILRDSEVFYSPSAFESFGIAGAEALCAGCSVVAGRSVSMASFEWFVGENSGVLADVDDAMGHFRTLERELGSWEQGRRDPRAIADIWTLRLHADRVAARVLELAARPNH
jgi:glycosyltransferase involved in cell wall biosynthesis